MPNGEDRKLGFVVKVRDPETDEFKPIYIAPDATDTVRGDVKLSDVIDSDLNAAEGMTAATPKAVKDAMSEVNKKVDKETEDPQAVVSDLSIGGKLSTSSDLDVAGKATVKQGADITGDLTVSRNLSIGGTETVTGRLNANGGLTVVGETSTGNITSSGDISAEGAGSFGSGNFTNDVEIGGQLTVTGESEFSGKMVAQKGITVPEGETFTGNLTGTADKVKQLDIEEDVGSKIEPVYFSGGKPVACGDYLGVTVVSETKPEGEQVLFWIEPEEKDKRLEG